MNELVNSIQESLQTQITKNHAEATRKHASILNEHILIPGVIGEMEDHRNLKSYLLDRENTIKMQHESIAKNADTSAADKVAELRQFMSQQMTVLEKQLGSNVSMI